MSRYLNHLIIIAICLIQNSLPIKSNFVETDFNLDFQQSDKLSTQIDNKDSKSKPKPQWRIVNGAHAEPGLFPWQVSFKIDEKIILSQFTV